MSTKRAAGDGDDGLVAEMTAPAYCNTNNGTVQWPSVLSD